jgi:hypothetical protein
MAAGVAALVDSATPGLRGEQVAARLRATVDPKNALSDITASGGRLNALRAVLDDESVPAPRGGDPSFPCDRDKDRVHDSVDQCPDTQGSATAHGCPDADGDGVQDSADNCPTVANADQANADGDAYGDACDSSPRGADVDGDGFPALDDRCPTQPGTVNGCPVAVVTPTPTPPPVVTPTPTPPPTITPVVPRIVSVGVKVAHNRKTARVTVRLTRTASTKVTVERRVKHHWARVTTRSFSATARGRALTVRTPKRGSYRVTVALAGARTVRRSFRV